MIGMPLLVTTSPLLDDKGKMIGVVHVAKDITEIRKAEDAMKEAIDIKEQFISIASHELRAPMGIIKESVEIISDETAGKAGPTVAKFVEIARRNIERLVRLSNNLLDFQKLSAGKFEFNMAEHDINKTVKEAVADMAILAKDKGLEFVMNFAEGLPPVKFDKDAIVEVVTNLISNAVKFTEKGRITVSSERAPDGVIVSVSDTGAGISRDDMKKLFLPFHQVGSPGGKKGGTGLGLVISKAMIEQHNGRIWAESKPGSGTTFKFLLPLG
jgi:signal transduction histidine kinase